MTQPLAVWHSSRAAAASRARARPQPRRLALVFRRSIVPRRPAPHGRQSRHGPLGAGLARAFRLRAAASRSGLNLRRTQGPLPEVASVRNWLAESRGRESPVLACDMPTGLGGPDVIKATATVTYHAEKWALRNADGEVQPDVGEIHTANLPWPAHVEDCGPGDARRHPPIRADARKGDRGRLLIIGGGPYHGAPILAGLAAERSGCVRIHQALPTEGVDRAGWPVSLYLLGAKGRLSGEAAQNARNWSGPTEPLSPSALDGAELSLIHI